MFNFEKRRAARPVLSRAFLLNFLGSIKFSIPEEGVYFFFPFVVCVHHFATMKLLRVPSFLFSSYNEV